MIAQSQPIPIPINRRRDAGFYGERGNRFPMQRIQNYTYNPPSPPLMADVGSPPLIPWFPRGGLQVWPASPPMLPLEGNFSGTAFPSDPITLENHNAIAPHEQEQYMDLRDETPSPPVGFSATIHGFTGPPYPMPLRLDISPPTSPQSPGMIITSMSPPPEETGEPRLHYAQETNGAQFQPFWPQNQLSPPFPFNVLPSPPSVPISPCGINSWGGSLPPQGQESLMNNFMMLRTMPNFADPSRLGMLPESVKPLPMRAMKGYDKSGGRRKGRCWTRTRGRKANNSSDNHVKMSEEEHNDHEKPRSFSTWNAGSTYCKFCKSNRETWQFYQSHVLKNRDGVTCCPVLRKYRCPICSAEGDNAHTMKYCPENPGKPTKEMLSKKRNSRGVIGAYHYG